MTVQITNRPKADYFSSKHFKFELICHIDAKIIKNWVISIRSKLKKKLAPKNSIPRTIISIYKIKKTSLLTIAALEDLGSLNICHITGCMRLKKGILPEVKPDMWSMPNLITKSSFEVLSTSILIRSKQARVSSVVLCLVYVFQQHGSTWLASRPQNSSSSSNRGPHTLIG